MDTYTVSFRFKSGTLDQHDVEVDPESLREWNALIEGGATIAFYDADGDLIVINTRFLETYSAVKSS